MKLIDKHILKNFFVPFVYILSSLLGLFLAYDISTKTARFLRHHVSFATILNFYSLYVPQLIALGLPMVILLAVVLGVGKMNSNNEITAMRASGVSVLRIARPLLVVGLVLTAVGFVIFEKVVTKTVGETTRFEQALKGQKIVQATAIEFGYFLTDDKGSRLQFVRFLPKEKVLQDIEWRQEGKVSRGIVTVTALEARWIDGSWWAFGAIAEYADGTYSYPYPKMRMYDWHFRPEEITIERLPDELTIAELRSNIRRYASAPQKIRKLQIELHRRFARPLLNVLTVLIALPFGLKRGRRSGGVAVGVGISMALCLSYYGLSVLMSLFEDMPPWMAVWLPNALFGAGGGIATLRLD